MARATYLPTISHSMLTASRFCAAFKFVCSIVNGTIMMSTRSVAEPCHGQADAVDRDRSLRHQIRREIRSKTHRQPMKIGLGAPVLDVTDAVDVPLHEVSAEPSVGAKRTLQVHAHALRKPSECCDTQRLGTDIRAKFGSLERRHREAHAVHGDTVAEGKFCRQRRLDRQPGAAARRLAVDDCRRPLQRGP